MKTAANGEVKFKINDEEIDSVHFRIVSSSDKKKGKSAPEMGHTAMYE